MNTWQRSVIPTTFRLALFAKNKLIARSKNTRRCFAYVLYSLTCLLLTFSSLSRSDVSFSEYWMVNEFFEKHPEQQSIAEAFNLKVQAAPERIQASAKPVKILVIYPG